jgi:Tannase and feruloyl esterase
VTKATLVPAAGISYEVDYGSEGGPRGVALPATNLNFFGEYCLVEGEVRFAAPEASKVIFHLALPSRWNGKSLHMDGRGDNKPPAPVDPVKTAIGIAPPAPIARGYAVYSREWGTQGLFGGEESAKGAHDAAMFLIAKHYGEAARYRYYYGAGGTGYESLTLIRAFPEDYHGILTQCPFLSITWVLHGHAIRRAAKIEAGAGEISAAKAAFLKRTIADACDGLDGLKDAIVSNVEACHVDLDELRCPGGSDTGDECFSDAQLTTLRAIYTSAKLPYALPSGETHLPAYPIVVDYWNPAVPINGSDKVIRDQLHGVLIRDLIFGGDPRSDVLAFDPLKANKAALARIQELSRLYDRGGADIDRFIARGGKWILTHGWEDGSAPATSSIEHYRKLVARYGQEKMDEVMRLYLIPGYGHGGGVPFNGNGAPNLEALEDWVERGHAPGTLTVVDANARANGRSRPMCRYPAWPKYDGSGDPQIASSFSCVIGTEASSAQKTVE